MEVTVKEIISRKEDFTVCGVCTTINQRHNKLCVSCGAIMKYHKTSVVFRSGQGKQSNIGSRDEVFKLYEETFEPNQLMNV